MLSLNVLHCFDTLPLLRYCTHIRAVCRCHGHADRKLWVSCSCAPHPLCSGALTKQAALVWDPVTSRKGKWKRCWNQATALRAPAQNHLHFHPGQAIGRAGLLSPRQEVESAPGTRSKSLGTMQWRATHTLPLVWDKPIVFIRRERLMSNYIFFFWYNFFL